jgi:nucleotide-binding universal stress UspA family protein
MPHDDAPPGSPRSARPSAKRTLVVGYDGSPQASAAVRWATQHAGSESRVIVVHAEHPALPAPAAQGWADRARANFAALTAMEQVRSDAELELIVAEGMPSDALVRAAREAGAEGIVVGRHAQGAFNADTVRQLLAITDLPVTVVPA